MINMTVSSAGQKLRAELDAGLAHAARESGEPLEWSEAELVTVGHAVAAADRLEELRALWDAELAGETRATVAIKMSAEARLCERHIVDLVARLSFGPERAKSERHVRAARSRWDRVPARGA
jgi:hypothetical protein